MIKILHAIDTPGPGGAESIFVSLISRLNRDLFTSYVVIPEKGWIYEELLRKNVTVFVVDQRGSFNFNYLIYLIKLIKSLKIDILHAHLLGSNVYCSIAVLFV